MITCTLKVHEDVDKLYKIFLSENLESDRAKCNVEKGDALIIDIEAKDPIAMKAFVNSVLKIIQTYEKTKDVK